VTVLNRENRIFIHTYSDSDSAHVSTTIKSVRMYTLAKEILGV